MSSILPENIEEEVKQQAEISMGSEISEEDILNITHLCDQVRLSGFVSDVLHFIFSYSLEKFCLFISVLSRVKVF